MQPVLLSALIGLVLLGLDPLAAQLAAAAPPAAPEPQSSAAELEAQFKAMLTNATLTGRWCAIKDGALTPSKEDQYTIVGVTKLNGESWIVNARIQYNQQDIVAPIPVTVKWAGDTPVLIVDKIPVPRGGTYSARVLFYQDTYAGTWSGGDHAGVLNGVISHPKTEKPADAK